MIKASFIREAQLVRLQQNIGSNAKSYAAAAPWLEKYFGADAWRLESQIDMPDDIALKMPSGADLFDLENTRTLYMALKHLTPVQAADERLWAYMTHVTHWNYMRARWPAERYLGKERFVQNIRERYFFMTHKTRAPVRNGLARLWWCGYNSYDESRADPFELTGALLKTLDVTQSILERAFAHNLTVTKSILSVLVEFEKAGKPFYVRDPVRALAQHLVQVGGVTILDALDAGDIRSLVKSKINQLAPEAVPA